MEDQFQSYDNILAKCPSFNKNSYLPKGTGKCG